MKAGFDLAMQDYEKFYLTDDLFYEDGVCVTCVRFHGVMEFSVTNYFPLFQEGEVVTVKNQWQKENVVEKMFTERSRLFEVVAVGTVP